jgi:formate hydrogenlyase transcriptional activator
MVTRSAEIVDLQTRQYLTLLELSKAIASHRDLTGLFQDLAGGLHNLFDFHSLAVILHDGTRKVMRMHILEPRQPEMQDFPRELPIDGSISGLVWQTQEPFVTPDVRQETRFPASKLVQGFPVRAICCLPLSTARQRLGVLSFSSDKVGAYDGFDLEFAGLVAGQIAVAVEAQCYQCKLERERDRSSLLLEINNVLVSNLNLKELLAAVSGCLRSVIPHDLAGLALYDPASNQLRLQALEFPSHQDFFIENEVVPLDSGPGGLAFTTGQMVFSDTSGKSDPVGKRFAAAGVKSGCIVPLISRDRTLGLLGVSSMRENAFTEEDGQVLGQVAKQVAIAVENALAYREIDALKTKLEEEKLYLEEEIRTEYNFEEIIGSSPVLKRMLQDVETVARTDSTVLIYGETGTGKELIARAIHNLSPRRQRTLVRVNCGAIPTGLLESEMFGHEKGAFTGAIERRIGRFETAHQGTIFLDEVEDIPLELQPKLLRVLQEQEFERLGSGRTIRVDIRVVAATNVDLAQMVAEKKFRSDLYYRLNVVPIGLPPLRERQEDIPLLVNFFANKFSRRMKKPVDRIPSETMAALVGYGWPGNIRELQNMVERAVTLSRGPVLEIPIADLKRSGNTPVAQTDPSTLESVEREHILRVLHDSNWVVGGPTGAAARLGMNRTTLNNRLRKLGITRPRL